MSEGYKSGSRLIRECGPRGPRGPDPASNSLPLKCKQQLLQRVRRRPVTGDGAKPAEYNETSYFPVNSEYFYIFSPPPFSSSLSRCLSPPPPSLSLNRYCHGNCRSCMEWL